MKKFVICFVSIVMFILCTPINSKAQEDNINIYEVSEYMSKLPTHSTQYEPSDINVMHFIGTNPTYNTFKYNDNMNTNMIYYDFNVPTDSITIINVPGKNVDLYTQYYGSNVPVQTSYTGTNYCNVLYNLYEAETFTLHDNGYFYGSIIAPYAQGFDTVGTGDITVFGNIVCKSYCGNVSLTNEYYNTSNINDITSILLNDTGTFTDIPTISPNVVTTPIQNITPVNTTIPTTVVANIIPFTVNTAVITDTIPTPITAKQESIKVEIPNTTPVTENAENVVQNAVTEEVYTEEPYVDIPSMETVITEVVTTTASPTETAVVFKDSTSNNSNSFRMYATTHPEVITTTYWIVAFIIIIIVIRIATKHKKDED